MIGFQELSHVIHLRMIGKQELRRVCLYSMQEGVMEPHWGKFNLYDLPCLTDCLIVQVIGDEFLTDASELPHVCTPQELGTDIANRIVYKVNYSLYLPLNRVSIYNILGAATYARRSWAVQWKNSLQVCNRLLWAAHSGEMDEEMGIGKQWTSYGTHIN